MSQIDGSRKGERIPRDPERFSRLHPDPRPFLPQGLCGKVSLGTTYQMALDSARKS